MDLPSTNRQIARRSIQHVSFVPEPFFLGKLMAVVDTAGRCGSGEKDEGKRRRIQRTIQIPPMINGP